MKIFVQGYKVNFVDEAGVFVGFCNEDDCCAFGGWYFGRSADILEDGADRLFEQDPGDLDGYRFDVGFHQTNDDPNSGEGGEEFVVRLQKEGCANYYLHCFNYHNGYYARGFEFCNGEVVLVEGCV